MAKIRCKRCGAEQVYRGQTNCDRCDVRLSDWSVASQLELSARPKNNDDEDDGA